jgi:hypothetical protein
MTNDRHTRIYEDGSTMGFPAFYTMYPIDDDGSGKRAMERNNQEVTEALIKKGFTRFTINMAIAAGIDKKVD